MLAMKNLKNARVIGSTSKRLILSIAKLIPQTTIDVSNAMYALRITV
jgi:hypothetical protein